MNAKLIAQGIGEAPMGCDWGSRAQRIHLQYMGADCSGKGNLMKSQAHAEGVFIPGGALLDNISWRITGKLETMPPLVSQTWEIDN